MVILHLNRAKLLNIGFVEALKEYDYNCFVFSDVDLIPMDDRNIYKCYNQPRHLSVSMDKFGFGLPYTQYFGGVSALSREQFERINGFPNNYWGWGGEDDDIYNRYDIYLNYSYGLTPYVPAYSRLMDGQDIPPSEWTSYDIL
ncbi:unnamed protein product [Staurois parvus]|uniref:Beta-1,4-galactosyltransferase n=1 Tax=Staurois parvus TaxID=386267 RepID=A0ABN9BZA6_9NEOB|nr:unnamed protein product [Staurois parvus]